jgi:hypothetical protein
MTIEIPLKKLKFEDRLLGVNLDPEGVEMIKEMLIKHEDKLATKGYTHVEICTIGDYAMRKHYSRDKLIPINTMVVLRIFSPKGMATRFMYGTDAEGHETDPVEVKIQRPEDWDMDKDHRQHLESACDTIPQYHEDVIR